MRIEQHDMRGWVLLKDGAQDQCCGARLAGAGRAEDGEVFAEQIVNADHGWDRTVLANAADPHGRAAIAAESRFEFWF